MPKTTLLAGENGSSKSTVLEGLSLISHLPLMRAMNKNPVDDPRYACILITLQVEQHVGTLIFANDSERGGYLTTHLTDEKLLASWQVYAEDKNFLSHTTQLIAQSRPSRPLLETDDHATRLAKVKDNRATPRAKMLLQLDESPHSERVDQIKQQSCVFMINTDMNTFGVGTSIMESPKNLSDDIRTVLHDRLPFTTATGDLRDLNLINQYWSRLFPGRSIERVSCDPNHERPATITLADASGKAYDAETLSSGENEAFFIIASIISLKLYNSVLLLDEPELHMHPNQLVAFHEVIHELCDRYQIQAIMVTHSPFVVDSILEDAEMRLLHLDDNRTITVEHNKELIARLYAQQFFMFYTRYQKHFDRWATEG